MNISINKITEQIFNILIGMKYKTELFDPQGNGPINEPTNSKYIFAVSSEGNTHSLMFVMPDNSEEEIIIYKDSEIPSEIFLNILERIKQQSKKQGIGITVRQFSNKLDKRNFVQTVKSNNEKNDAVAENISFKHLTNYLK